MKILKSSALLVFLLLCALEINASTEAFRKFTDRQGRNVHARVEGVSGDTYKLRMANGRLFEVGIGLFCEQDQQYLLNWKRDQISKKSSWVEVNTFRKTGKKLKDEGISAHVKKWTEYYVLELKNTTRVGFKNLTIEYTYEIEKEQFGKKKRESTEIKKTKHQATLASLPAGQTATIKTKKVTLESSKLDGDYVWVSDDISRQSKDKLIGIRVIVLENGKQIGSN